MTNSNLIPVFNGTIANQAIQLCNARELHSFLEVKTQFGNWITDRISDYGFIQDEDYIIVTQRTNGRPRKEYHITLDMGKELGMVERNEKGRQIRRYFIECEKRALQNQQQNLPLAQPEPTYSRTLTKRQWLKFASLWFTCYNNLELLARIYPPLEALGSRLGVEAYTHCTEYRTTLEVMKRILEPMLAEFDVDPRKEPHSYRALRTLREFELKGLGAIVKI